jgi:spore coat polysaccharide biosynthesis predicted glycosyltransferase SpsG
MTRAPILFRVDGTRQIGWESLWRCLVCGAALQRRRRPTFFLSQLQPPDLAPFVKRGGNEWINATAPLGSPEDLDQTLREIRRLNPAAVLVDGAAAEGDYLRAIHDTGVVLVTLDHTAHVDSPARLVINPLLGPARESYELDPRAQALFGARYALVRPEIRRVRPLRSQEPAQPFRCLIALGDDDRNNQAGELAKLLMNCPKVDRVYVAVRPHHPDLLSLRELAQSSLGQLEIAVEPAEVTARIGRSHFAITAGNAWSLELACVGIPQLLVVQEEAHWPTAQRLEEEGAATCLGWHESISAQTIRQAVQNLLGDPLERQAMSRCGRQLIDGRGPDRFVTALEVVLYPTRQTAVPLAA